MDFGTALPSVTSPDRARSKELAARLAAVESRNVTWLGDTPPFWTRARGANVADADGNVYLDFTGAFGVAFAGHRHPAVVGAVARQAGELIHGMGDIHPPAVKVELLEALAAVAPWPDAKGFLANSGSEAVEAALKTAHVATGRAGVVAFRGSYHGLALGALAATDREHFRAPFVDRLTPHVTFVPFPAESAEADRSLDAVRNALRAGEVGAVMVEPIQGRGGVRIPPAGFLGALVDAARESGALVIFDEVFTGLGRTGRRFALDHEDAVPDLLCLGKALGGGVPISACLAPARVMDAWPASEGEAVHTSTFLGHPLGCAAGLAFLGVLESERLAERAGTLGDQARVALAEAVAGGAVEVRGRGLMLGVDLGVAGAGAEAARFALEAGLIVLPAGADGQVVEMTPPATITEEQLDVGLEILIRAIRSAS